MLTSERWRQPTYRATVHRRLRQLGGGATSDDQIRRAEQALATRGMCDPTRFRVAVVLLLEQRSTSALGAIEDRAPWEWVCGYALGAGPWPVDLDKHAATLDGSP